MDPHVPYAPPPPFDRRYEPAPAADHPAADPRFDFAEPEDRDRFVAQYDGEIAYGDQEFGRFVHELRARGLYDDALVVFLADHGEEFLDHDQWMHGTSVFDELVRVPLVVKFPRRRDAGRRIRQQVQTVDVLPTVLAELGLPVPTTPAIAGHPLQAVIRGGVPEPIAISHIADRGHVAFGARRTEDKYVWRFSPEDDQLYFDLQKDPAEKANRLEPSDERARALRAAIEESLRPAPYQQHLRLAGDGAYALTLRTTGFFDAAETVGFGASDRADIDGGRHAVSVAAAPRRGQPRELILSVRPMGAPVWLAGTRDGRPLAAEDVHMAREDLAPAGVPFRLPELEPVASGTRSSRGRAARPRGRGGARIDESRANMLEPPAGAPEGVLVWLTLRPGVQLLEMDAATRERMKALGYLGP
jgi:hypothetical protein